MTGQPPRELWRIAYTTREPVGSDVATREHVDYFETERGALSRLRTLVPNNGKVLGIHKLAGVDGGRRHDQFRWVELTYTPPVAQGTLAPVPPPQAAAP